MSEWIGDRSIIMKNIAKKTRFSLLIYSELVAGILCYVLVAAVTGLLIWSAINSEERIDDIVTVIIMILFLTRSLPVFIPLGILK